MTRPARAVHRASVHAAVVQVLALVALVGLGAVGGGLVGRDPFGLTVAFLAVAAASVWLSRLGLAAVWWVHTGTWDWRRTRLRRAVRDGWGGPR